MTTMALGDILRAKREAAGYTQQDLADQFGFTRQAISSWECGRSEPDVASLKQLAALYDSSLDDLLNNMDVERPPETLRMAAVTLLFIGYSVCLITLGVAVWKGTGWFAFALCSAYGIVMNSIFWFALSGSIKSGSAAWLAGFWPSATYHKPTLRRLLDNERLWLIAGTTSASIPFSLAVLFGWGMNYLFIVFLAMIHILALYIGMEWLQNQYGETLYPRKEDHWIRRVSSRPWTIFICVLFLMLIASGIGPTFLGLQSNTPQAFAYAGLLLLNSLLVSIGPFVELNRPAKAAKAGEPYKMRRVTVMVYLLSVVVDISMVAICL